jgi:hypothetical protein
LLPCLLKKILALLQLKYINPFFGFCVDRL